MPDETGATTKSALAAGGGVIAAIASALCCAGPLAAVALGVSGAGLAARFEPLRPYFLIATALLLGAGFWVLRREESRACEPGRLCASPAARRRMRIILYVATGVAILFATFPAWSAWVLS
ncbi:MAG TPA: mercuric transporter MerT family protein [Gemmatimonadaceae bacterium]|jgi:mercuric ion transport protein